MSETALMEGVYSQTIEAPGLTTHLLFAGPEDGIPIIFIHGNASSSRFFEDTLAALPPGYRGMAPDLSGFGGSETRPLDARRGLSEFAEDLASLVEALGLSDTAIHLLGWSVGGTVAIRYAMDRPSAVASLILLNPMSPYGFGGTRDLAGTPCWADFAGSGGGTANPEFVRRLRSGDRTGEDPSSPRNVMNNFYFRPPFRPDKQREEVYLSSVLSTKTGAENYPGDMTTSENWPGVAPGEKGMNNAISPRYCDLSGFASIDARPPVLWIRGAEDRIVSDESLLDFGTLGALGLVEGWPGEEVYPPQPMVSQTRTILDAYASAGAGGGSYREEIIAGCGHSPHIEKPDEFRSLVFGFLKDIP